MSEQTPEQIATEIVEWLYDHGFQVNIERVADAIAKARRDGAESMRAKCERSIRYRWTFNTNQEHTHNWHDFQDCLDEIRALPLPGDEPKDPAHDTR